MIPRRTCAALAAASIACLAPAVAHADSTISSAGGQVTVEDASADSNVVNVTISGGMVTVTDAAGAGPGPGCTGGNGTVECPSSGVGSMSITLGDGNDQLSADVPLNVTVQGQDGDDTLTTGPGNDAIAGGTGDDSEHGGAGDDALDTGPGPGPGGSDGDVLVGDDGFDSVSYSGRTTAVNVSLNGTADDGAPGERDSISRVEQVTGGSAGDTITSNDGAQTLNGGPGGDTLAAGAGDDTLDGGGDADNENGGDGNDALAGGDADDTLDGGAGADAMSGGPGSDLVSYGARTGPVTVTLDGVADDGETFGATAKVNLQAAQSASLIKEGDNVQTDVERVDTGAGADTLTGSAEVNKFTSGDGEDYVDGGNGADEMHTGGALDVVRARDGVADTVDCGDGRDYAILDKSDTVSGSCEVFDRGTRKRPQLAKRFIVRPRGVSGQQFSVRGMKRFVPLQDQLLMPLGWRIDPKRGSVRLITARKKRRRSQSAILSGGKFLVKQRRSSITDLRMTGGKSFTKTCGTPGTAKAAASRSRRLRRLFGRGRGRFRTRGRFSSATVRGTVWTVTDRCDGTLTTVRRGTVKVRDRVRHRTVILHRGERYLARARRR